MSRCGRCGIGECARIGSDPTVLRCNYCDACWPDYDGLAGRFAALEIEHAKDRARIERLERVLLGLARQVNTPEWMHDEVGPDITLLCAITSDLEALDRERGGG